jgi:intraflagellar transport protein 122
MNTIDVPQSTTFFRFLEKRDFQMAYKLACLGVTEQDWRALGIDALLVKNFKYAHKAFCRIRDLKFIDLCQLAENMDKMKSLEENWL